LGQSTGSTATKKEFSENWKGKLKVWGVGEQDD